MGWALGEGGCHWVQGANSKGAWLLLEGAMGFSGCASVLLKLWVPGSPAVNVFDRPIIRKEGESNIFLPK